MKLDHLNVYVNDVNVSREFYEAVLIPFGFSFVRDFGDLAVGFGTSDYAIFAIVRELEAIQTTHVAFRVDSRSEVDRFYEIALSAGANDNGPPGLRPHYHENYYAAFVRDPDGHNIECVCHKPVS
ncbi:MAG: catechol 2,3-dioxygenase-like lactoylglutathione lyase family enzyme [Gammaproteobacteria bacterium]|jgi:catechol 2,3-dioxygenase-like lactoylglutathione lyase family enzyme